MKRLLDMVFPRTCFHCGRIRPEGNSHLCWDCAAAMMYVQPPYCDRCGRPVAGAIDGGFVCHVCSGLSPVYDRARAAALYEGVARDLLVELKYRAGLWVVDDAVRIMLAGFHAHYQLNDFDAIAYVPLHPVRRRERGFNQASLLARGMARCLHRPVLHGCLFRRRPTPSQTNLTASQRVANVKGAFGARNRRWIDGKRVLLVDDVMTTGSTVGECARALKTKGAARVDVLTLARG